MRSRRASFGHKTEFCDEAYIYQLEAGKVANPRGDTLNTLAKALGVTVGQLTGNETEGTAEEKAKNTIAEITEMLRVARVAAWSFPIAIETRSVAPGTLRPNI